MPEKAPVEKVGGPQEEGPWPANVEEIVAGESYDRELDGTIVSVTVTEVVEDTEQGGHHVAFQRGGN